MRKWQPEDRVDRFLWNYGPGIGLGILFGVWLLIGLYAVVQRA